MAEIKCLRLVHFIWLYSGRYRLALTLPVITRNNYGKGMAYYIGANVDQECLSNCFVDVLKTAGIEAEKLPDGIQYYERVSEDGTRYVFYINASDEEQQIALAGTYLDLITGQEVRDSITVPALCLAVLEDQDRV